MVIHLPKSSMLMAVSHSFIPTAKVFPFKHTLSLSHSKPHFHSGNVDYSVTRWLYYLLNIWPFTTINISLENIKNLPK